MKKNIFKTLAVFSSFALLLLTSCVNGFEGTTKNYAQKSEQYTGNYGENKSALALTNGNVSASPIYQAGENTDITVNLESCKLAIDLSNLDNALTFYKLKNNSKYKYAYPEHDGEIQKERVSLLEPLQFPGEYKIIYRLDTREVTTNKIALVVDATKLRYKDGTGVYNMDSNLTAGEATDSFVKYITVTKKANGEDTTTLSFSSTYTEDFAPTYNITELTYRTELLDSEGKATGKHRLYCYAPATAVNDGLYQLETSTYNENLADILSRKFKLQVQMPDSTNWEDKTLTFTYHSTSNTGSTDPYYSNSYTTDVDTNSMGPGAKWRVVCDKSISIGAAPECVKDIYGHPVYEYLPKVKALVYPTDANPGYVLLPYGNKDTPYIFAWDRSWTFTSPESSCSYTSAQTAQSSMFTITAVSGNPSYIKIEPDIGNDVDLDATDGFILIDTNTNHNKAVLETEKTIHTNADNVIDAIYLTLKNQYYNGSVSVYVNDKTTLKSNSINTNQKSFGCYPDQTNGTLSGYVKIDDGTLEFTNSTSKFSTTKANLVLYNSASDDPDEYTFAYIGYDYGPLNEQGYNTFITAINPVFDYYLTPGSYIIQLSNSRYNTSIVKSKYSDIHEYPAIAITGNTSSYVVDPWDSYRQINITQEGVYSFKCYDYYGDDRGGWFAFRIYAN